MERNSLVFFGSKMPPRKVPTSAAMPYMLIHIANATMSTPAWTGTNAKYADDEFKTVPKATICMRQQPTKTSMALFLLFC